MEVSGDSLRSKIEMVLNDETLTDIQKFKSIELAVSVYKSLTSSKDKAVS